MQVDASTASTSAPSACLHLCFSHCCQAPTWREWAEFRRPILPLAATRLFAHSPVQSTPSERLRQPYFLINTALIQSSLVPLCRLAQSSMLYFWAACSIYGLDASDREGLLALGNMAAEEVVLLFLTARPALHASAEQRAAFDLPSRSLRRALCSGALFACGLAAPQPQALVLQRCR